MMVAIAVASFAVWILGIGIAGALSDKPRRPCSRAEIPPLLVDAFTHTAHALACLARGDDFGVRFHFMIAQACVDVLGTPRFHATGA